MFAQVETICERQDIVSYWYRFKRKKRKSELGVVLEDK